MFLIFTIKIIFISQSRRGRKLFDKIPNLHFITTTITGFQKVFCKDNRWNDTYCMIIINHLIWKNRFDDYIITSEHMLEVKMGYIHVNPRRAKLVKEITDWKYSSARNYYLDDNSIIKVGFPED